MTRMASMLHQIRYMLLALLVIVTGSVQGQTQPQPLPLYFTGLAGGEEAWGRRVLIRWYTLEQLIPLDTAVIYRTDKNGTREKIATVKETRSASVISNIFFRPGEELILEDAQKTLERVYGTSGDTPQEFAQLAIDLLEGEGIQDYATTRRNFLVQTNYGFSIIEGLGYLDFVDPANGPYVYELWQGDLNGEPQSALGKIQIDVSKENVLPAPLSLKEIFLRGRDGVTPARANHRRIFLDWEVSPALFEVRDINFGFDIYRLNRTLENGENFDSVSNELIKVNNLPILPPSPLQDEPEDQSYLFADDGDWLDTLDEEDLLTVGDTYTYWAVARDLLGNAGLPSNALVATVRDTFEPDFPRGLNIVPERDMNDTPLLRVFFDRQDEDTVAYRLYRYQSYQNHGKVGPFADIDGLTEGLIAEIPLPASPNVTRIMYDDYEPGTTEPGRVFWYCVAAIDDHGNQSAISPPARGVIDDVLPPMLDGVLEICRSLANPFIDASVALEPEGREEAWRPLFKIDRKESFYRTLRIISIVQDENERDVETLIAEIELSAGVRFFEPEADESIEGRGDIPTYRFEAVLSDGRTDQVDVSPPTWLPGSPRACYDVILRGRGYDLVCLDVADNDKPMQVPVIPGGDLPPLRLLSGCPDDSESLRLYRSVNGGQTYTFVKEFMCGENATELIDNFHPDGLVQAKYSISPVDENGNIGIPYRIPSEFIYLGDVPRPTMTEVIATGSNIPSQRSVRVKWVGPKQGISHYEVIIRPKPNGGFKAAPVNPLEFPLSDVNDAGVFGDFSFDQGTGEYSINVDQINRDSTEINPDVEYLVSVAAVPKAGAKALSSNQLPLLWSTDALGFSGGGGVGILRWAARPLPESFDGGILTVRQEQQSGFGAALISIRGENSEFPPFDIVKPPFMVWRRRADIANENWTSVSPVIESIRRSNGILDDPFFLKINTTVWFVDDTGHVPFRPYEYMILKLNEDTYEIEQAIGPIDFQVDLIPQ